MTPATEKWFIKRFGSPHVELRNLFALYVSVDGMIELYCERSDARFATILRNPTVDDIETLVRLLGQ